MDVSTRSDCLVEVELRTRGGITLELESKVVSLYGESMKRLLKEVCSRLDFRHGAFRVVDQGALPYVLAARVEAAIKRALPQTIAEFLPEARTHRRARHAKTRPRRTRLYLPGNEPKFFPNAGLHQPDVIVLDLEDSVAPEQKDAARILVRNALRAADFYGAERGVRINQGQLGLDDLRALVPQHPDLILIPKCDDAEIVRIIDGEIQSIEKPYHSPSKILMLPIIENALGVVNAFAIASASQRVCALAIGLEDYTADIGVARTASGTESLFARSAVVNAAKAVGLQALDSVFSDVDDDVGLRQSSLEAKAIGFDGKGCIHPRQIKIVHEAFAPSADEIAYATRVVEAFEEAQRNGSGVVALGSKMIDPPVVRRAQRVLALARMR